MPCKVCRGSKQITLPLYEQIDPSVTNSTKVFACPECVPTVPYKRVRAMKVTTAYPAEEFGRLQVPIERGMAARFGEYLMREGLIKFTTKGSADFGVPAEKITITAHLGVVSATDVVRAGAEPEIARTSAPSIDQARYGKNGRSSQRGKRWVPPVLINFPDDPVTDEFDEPRDAVASRFGGLEFD